MNRNIKRLLILNAPYFLIGLCATKLGQAYRLAVGSSFSDKLLHLMDGFTEASHSPLPSFYPTDLMVGLCCGAGLRLAVYIKSKNAKKFRKNTEYGSARWGTADDIREYYRRNSLDANGVQNVMQEFGSQRVAHVLAATVKAKDWDARFSPENRAWAATVPTPPNLDAWGDDRNLHFVVNSHSGLTNLFLNQFRTAQEQDRKPSVMQQLKPAQHTPKAPVPGKHIQER